MLIGHHVNRDSDHLSITNYIKKAILYCNVYHIKLKSLGICRIYHIVENVTVI